MPDEIDLLAAFRADTPGPDDAAWERARTAVALAEGAAAPDPRPGGRRPGGGGDSAGTGSRGGGSFSPPPWSSSPGLPPGYLRRSCRGRRA